MSFLFHLLRKYPLSSCCFAVIWILSFVPFFPETPLDNVKFIDKWVHIAMYGGTCTVLWLEYIRHHQQPDYEKLGVWAWLTPIVMSGIIELMQEYCTSTRSGDWLDLVANATGVTLAALVGLTLLRLHAIRKKGA